MKTILFTILALVLVGCSDQTKAALGETVMVDGLPEDICLIKGKPEMISISVENEGDIDFSYFSNHGTIVNLKYGGGFIGVGTREQGRLEWKMSSPLACDK